MERIDRGEVSLLYFTVRREDFQNLYPQPPYHYFLVTQVFDRDGHYLCSQLLGIDLRAVKSLDLQGCPHRTGAMLGDSDRQRVQHCLDQYARHLVNKVATLCFGHSAGGSDLIQ